MQSDGTRAEIMFMDELMYRSMKQSEAESRRWERRPLNEHEHFDERDTWLESSRAFIMPQSSASAPSGCDSEGKTSDVVSH